MGGQVSVPFPSPVADASRATGPREWRRAQITYRDAAAVKRLVGLEDADAHDILEGFPIRKSNSNRRQRSMIGERWVEKTGALIPVESMNERRFVITADFDPMVLRIVAQPFRFRVAPGRPSHVPDFLTLRRDGTIRVVNVRPVEQFDAREQERMHSFASAIATLGWEHAMWHDLPLAVFQNLDWLSRMNVPGAAHPMALEAAQRLWNYDCYGSLEEKMKTDVPREWVRPAIDRLIWEHVFDVDLRMPLDVHSVLHRRTS
nr:MULTISPECIES: TnsA-like heteromeric transposase endonuclease subunit [unclassified Frigoribacterium]